MGLGLKVWISKVLLCDADAAGPHLQEQGFYPCFSFPLELEAEPTSTAYEPHFLNQTSPAENVEGDCTCLRFCKIE